MSLISHHIISCRVSSLTPHLLLSHASPVVLNRTWAGKGWVPKPVLRGQLDKVYVLDFFGSERLPKEKPSFKVPAKRFLTAFGYPGNQFLGYFMDEAVFAQHHSATRSKKQQGVIWGKDPNHFSRGRDQMLQRVAEGGVMLHSTASRPVFKHRNVIWSVHTCA